MLPGRPKCSQHHESADAPLPHPLRRVEPRACLQPYTLRQRIAILRLGVGRLPALDSSQERRASRVPGPLHIRALPVGTARLNRYPAEGATIAAVVLGHGTATGVEYAVVGYLLLPAAGAPDRKSRAAPHARLAQMPSWPWHTRCSAQAALPSCWVRADRPSSCRATRTPSVVLISSRSCRRTLSSSRFPARTTCSPRRRPTRLAGHSHSSPPR